MNTCITCKYWINQASCVLIGDGPSRLYAKSIINSNSKPNTREAWTTDADSYHSELITMSTFGCNQHEPGEPIYDNS